MDDKTFELIEKMYSEFSKRFDGLEKKFDILENDNKEMKDDIKSVKENLNKTNVTIEHDLMPKIEVLFDGQLQNIQQLERIENAVSKHEDIIMRKIK
ncbi:hypothetical protein [Anaerosalibacter sp. Marseille-P3206]|uniref:hypothetical protein n=1 Tax=Anaerosalibacter sp. Marseille-P3206 TaxID=1871005 RepID=UPI00190EFBE1|nr:hypothetical protein [Anaerosalibacter sp. Marseille-P3206]